MRKITLGTTYYNCPDLLTKFIDTNLSYVDELIVVDDGSRPEFAIDNVASLDNNLRFLKVETDKGFNSHGCRNLIMEQASNDWVVLIDIDREFQDPQYTFQSIKSKTNLFTKARYLFIVHVNKWGHNVHSSVNDYLINRHHFFSAGGYDEEIAGERWGDREFFKQLLSAGGTESILHDINLIHTRISTVLSDQKFIRSPNDTKGHSHNELIQSRINKPQQSKPILQFNWHEVS